MMKSGVENVKMSYEESLKDFVNYMMENPGKKLTLDLRLPSGYKKNEAFMEGMDTMNEYIRNLGSYPGFSVVKNDGLLFMSRVTYDTEKSLGYVDFLSLNGALGEISTAASKISYGMKAAAAH